MFYVEHEEVPFSIGDAEAASHILEGLSALDFTVASGSSVLLLRCNGLDQFG